MEHRIANLKTDFNEISLVRDRINNVFGSLKGKMDKLKNLYSDFIKNGKSQIFVFGLDTFHFQSKLIDLEYDDMIRMFLAINNRMYCEYFKLYKIIISYVTENVSDKKILDIIRGNNFPIYKDLEPFKDYKFEVIIELHENILILLNSIMSIVNHRENELSLHRNKQLIGLNIDNFVNSFNFEIVIMKEKINLFLSYIEFFHKMHAKYMQRFNNKISLMYNNINSDIHFDDTPETEEKKNEDTNNKSTNLKLELNNEETYAFNNNNNNNNNTTTESGLSTPSNYSFNFNENENENESIKQKNNLKSMFKNGIKKVSNIINGCNNSNAIDNKSYNTDYVPFDYFNNINKFEHVNELVKSNTNISIILDNNFESSDVVNEEAPIEEAPIEEVAIEETPSEEAPIEEAPSEEAPFEEAPIEEAPIEETPIEEVFIENSTNKETVNVEGEKKVNETLNSDKIENGKKKKRKKKTT
jgi:hypothetical protein